MKKAGFSIFLVLLLATACLLTACTTSGPGGLVTEKKDLSGFTRVDAEGTFEVEITRSDEYSVSISVDRSFYDYISVTKEGDTLNLSLNPRHTFTDFTLQARTLKAEITMPDLYSLNLSGASKGTITGFKSSHDFSLTVSGASSLNINDGEVGDAELNISGASKVIGGLKAADVKLTVSGASEVGLEGQAANINAEASGASKLNLTNFPLNNANIQLSGASQASLDISGRLDCFLSSASSLHFQGNPTMGNVSVTGASTIKHR